MFVQSQRSQTEAVTFLANHDDSRALYAIPGMRSYTDWSGHTDFTDASLTCWPHDITDGANFFSVLNGAFMINEKDGRYYHPTEDFPSCREDMVKLAPSLLNPLQDKTFRLSFLKGQVLSLHLSLTSEEQK